jgi:hypothetical protein
VAIGVLELHYRGIFHNNLGDERSLEVKNGRAQICRFGLLDGTASFRTDMSAYQDLFGQLGRDFVHLQYQISEPDDPYWHGPTFEDYIRDIIDDSRELLRLRELSEAIKQEARPTSCPFDLFFHLVHSGEFWRSRDEPLDVGGALSELTRGLDEAGKAGFKTAVNDQLASRGFLHFKK